MKGQDATPQTVLRRDAARNRRRILEAARVIANDGKPLQLNVVAQRANVGVGTVYRHFPNPEALTEALASDQLASLIEKVHAAPRTLPGLRGFLRCVLALLVRDGTFASALIDPVTDEMKKQRHRLLNGLRTLIAGTVAAEPLAFPALAPSEILLLLCGVGFGIRHAPDRNDPAFLDRYLKALLDGILPRHIA
ncbi:TetR family transcriptional regulator [Mycolicibacterium agri]|uniref:TetR family transcriptional regulator n=1 Tax=Mycolicibacterium agri TaxID=36811 RepID=A0A7I9WCN8_MYCAG|nr:TetR family transcriptional regulator [Mycolicibacterium agri]